ncbi:MAG: aminopeptidase, partial [bacterium]|nr:aminopeptidase [bacterium]
MMSIKRNLIVTVLALILLINTVVLAQAPGKDPDISANDIMFHIMFLASEELGGRKAGTDEGRKAAAYIAGWFEDYGLKPVGDYDSYFQVFEFTGGIDAGPGNKLSVRTGDTGISYNINSDYIPYGFSANQSVSGEVVFAGYGISSEDDNYD